MECNKFNHGIHGNLKRIVGSAPRILIAAALEFFRKLCHHLLTIFVSLRTFTGRSQQKKAISLNFIKQKIKQMLYHVTSCLKQITNKSRKIIL